MRKFGIIIMVVMLLGLGNAGLGYASTITVPTDFSTIEAAITAAADGDTIMVMAGTYNPPAGGYTVNKALNIKGQSGALKTFIETVNTSDHGFKITKSNVTIDGFTVHPPAGMVTAGASAGIIIGGTSWGTAVGSPVNNVKVQNCIVEFFDFGIVILNAAGALVQKNTVRYQTDAHSWGAGIFLYINGVYDITNAKITNNAVHDNGNSGIYLYDPSAARTFEGTIISSNTLFNNFSDDYSLAPGNNNLAAINIRDANGAIHVSSNKILALSPAASFQPINISNSPGVVKSNNHLSPGLKFTLSGTATLIP